MKTTIITGKEYEARKTPVDKCWREDDSDVCCYFLYHGDCPVNDDGSSICEQPDNFVTFHEIVKP